MPQDFPYRFDLMRQLLHTAQAFQTEEFVEPAQQAQPGMFLVQPKITRIGRAASHPERLRVKRDGDAAGSDPAVDEAVGSLRGGTDFGAASALGRSNPRRQESFLHGEASCYYLRLSKSG